MQQATQNLIQKRACPVSRCSGAAAGVAASARLPAATTRTATRAAMAPRVAGIATRRNSAGSMPFLRRARHGDGAVGDGRAPQGARLCSLQRPCAAARRSRRPRPRGKGGRSPGGIQRELCVRRRWVPAGGILSPRMPAGPAPRPSWPWGGRDGQDGADPNDRQQQRQRQGQRQGQQPASLSPGVCSLAGAPLGTARSFS